MRIKKKIAIYSFLASIIICFISYVLGGEYLLMPGLLSEEHEILSNVCGNCHTPFKNQFKSCGACHNNIKKRSLHSEETLKCILCHTGHKEKYLKTDINRCLSKPCHKKMQKVTDHSGNPKLCIKCHLEHQSKKIRRIIKSSDLIFSHRIHTNKLNIKAYSPCELCHQIYSGRVKIGAPKAMDQCRKCHSKILGKHDTEKNITKNDCAWCHFSKKRELKKLGEKFRLKFARFKHQDHFNLDCIKCHFRIETYNELDDIFILSQNKKYPFCTQCHAHKNYPERVE